MIEIVTLFLGLYNGAQAVEVRAGEPVAAVELRLDGETVEKLSQPPWIFRFDLGTELAPHLLVAVGYGADGAEFGRSLRWINRGAVPEGSEGLTAVAVRLDGRRRLPPVEEMAGWFFGEDGEPLEVVRAERGAATVTVVVDDWAWPFLDATEQLQKRAEELQDRHRRFLRLGDEVTFRFLAPRAPPVSRIRSPKELFPLTQSPAGNGNGLL